MGDSYVTDIAAHPACEVLLAAWQSRDAEQKRALVRDIEVPGPIALRSRYRMLLDIEAPSGPWNPDLTPEAWVRQLRLETEGDNAVRSGSRTAALAAFQALLDEGTGSRPQLPTVHAHIGFGKVAMDRNDIEAASEHFETATAVADESMYRFGRVQALVPWAYMTLWNHSAELALDQFQEAAGIASALDDPVYRGNSLLGAAECAQWLDERAQAEQHGKEAYAAFSAVRSALGQGLEPAAALRGKGGPGDPGAARDPAGRRTVGANPPGQEWAVRPVHTAGDLHRRRPRDRDRRLLGIADPVLAQEGARTGEPGGRGPE